MKIQFIGTGNMYNSIRFNASVIINNSILIDVPPGIVKQLLKNKVDIKSIKSILITHQHIDHYFDLPILIQYFTLHNISAITIFANQNIINSFPQLIKLAFPDEYEKILSLIDIHFIPLQEDKAYTFNGVNILPIPVIHGKLNHCFAFIIKQNEKSIGYSGDASYTKEIEYLCKNSNHIILDSTKLIGDTDHMGIDNIQSLCQKYKNKTIYANHISEHVQDYKLSKIKNLVVPDDNEIFEI